MLQKLILVALGGGFGSILRFLISTYVSKQYAANFPWGTFVVNIVGCFIIGLLSGLASRYNIFDNELRSLLIVGFCGGFTTFSTFSSENLNLFESGNYLTLAAYILLSISCGLIAVWIGNLAVRLFAHP